jgi:hypothetical protein
MFLVFFAPLLFGGCSAKRPPDKTAHEKNRPTALAELTDSDTEVFPLPNGNAHLVNNIDQQLFLLSGGQAERIRDVELNGFESTIYSLPSGAAYLVSSDGKKLRLYYLVGNKATSVQEGVIPAGAIQGKAVTTESYLWSQNQAALARQRRARADADGDVDPREPDDR